MNLLEKWCKITSAAELAFDVKIGPQILIFTVEFSLSNNTILVGKVYRSLMKQNLEGR